MDIYINVTGVEMGNCDLSIHNFLKLFQLCTQMKVALKSPKQYFIFGFKSKKALKCHFCIKMQRCIKMQKANFFYFIFAYLNFCLKEPFEHNDIIDSLTTTNMSSSCCVYNFYPACKL